ncbi:MAG: hypothetical protein KC713_08015, partial [Candidatus Omnitrophica bacterium]|nr:hypothetical protein [Candidatus Omnitrophota bacterium]
MYVKLQYKITIFITAIIAVVFFGLYYLISGNLQSRMTDIIKNQLFTEAKLAEQLIQERSRMSADEVD